MFDARGPNGMCTATALELALVKTVEQNMQVRRCVAANELLQKFVGVLLTPIVIPIQE